VVVTNTKPAEPTKKQDCHGSVRKDKFAEIALSIDCLTRRTPCGWAMSTAWLAS
jgi:hypothetical protein